MRRTGGDRAVVLLDDNTCSRDGLDPYYACSLTDRLILTYCQTAHMQQLYFKSLLFFVEGVQHVFDNYTVVGPFAI